MSALSAISLCPIGSKALGRILKRPHLRDTLIAEHIRRENARNKWESEKAQLAYKTMYVIDYGLRLVAASNGAQPPNQWLSDVIFGTPKAENVLDRDLIKAAKFTKPAGKTNKKPLD